MIRPGIEPKISWAISEHSNHYDNIRYLLYIKVLSIVHNIERELWMEALVMQWKLS